MFICFNQQSSVERHTHAHTLVCTSSPAHTSIVDSTLLPYFAGSLLSSCALEDEQVVLTYMKNATLTTIELQCGVSGSHRSSAAHL